MEYLKLVYVGFAFPHHENTMGGYHHIASSLKYDYCVDCQTLYNQFSAKSSSVLAKMIRGINRILWGQHIVPWYLLRVYGYLLPTRIYVFMLSIAKTL